jgi:hypothetical protein
MVELVPSHRGHIEVFEAVIVIVPDSYSHSVPFTAQAGFRRNVFECTVTALVLKPIPILFPSLCRSYVLAPDIDRRSIHEEEVEPSIVVIIKKGHARTHRFNQVTHRSM